MMNIVRPVPGSGGREHSERLEDDVNIKCILDSRPYGDTAFRYKVTRTGTQETMRERTQCASRATHTPYRPRQNTTYRYPLLSRYDAYP